MGRARFYGTYILFYEGVLSLQGIVKRSTRWMENKYVGNQFFLCHLNILTPYV